MSNIWESYDVIEGIVVSPYYDPGVGELTDWPAERGGRFLAVREFEASYNISSSRGYSTTLRVSWALRENESFTAGCISDGQEYYETFNNTFTVTYNVSWSGGYISFEAHVYNASALYWLHTIPILWAPDNGYWKMGILGAEVASPTGALQWSSPLAARPMDPDMAARQPVTSSRGDPLQVLQDPSIAWLLSYEQSYPVFEFLPWEVFPGALAGLQNVDSAYSSGWMPGGTGYYDEYKYTIAPLGPITVPGENESVPAWLVEFETSPPVARGNYTVTTLTVIPLKYDMTLVTLENETINIKFNLDNIVFMDWRTGQRA